MKDLKEKIQEKTPWPEQWNDQTIDNAQQDLSTILTMKADDVRQLVKDHIKDAGERTHVFHILGLFLLNKPDIAKKLIDLIRTGDEDNSIENFCYLVYENIENILIEKRDAIEHETGPIENPGKKQITTVLENIQQHRRPNFEKKIAEDTLSWLIVPGFPIWLLPKEWIAPVK